MINLIPNEEKKKTARDFYLRLITLFFIMLGLSLAVTSTAILPSYFLSSIEKDFINSKLESQKNESVSLADQNTSAVVGDLKNKLGLIEKIEKNKSIFSQKIINEILLKKMPNIKITGIFYQNNSRSGKTINISGIAPNREGLLLFRRILEDNTAFSKVNLPISNFIKGSDIKFYLSLTPS